MEEVVGNENSSNSVLEDFVFNSNDDVMINVSHVKSYLRILDDVEDDQLLLLLQSAIDFVAGYTGLDRYFVSCDLGLRSVILIIVNDFYWNRDYQTSNKYTNKLVENILASYRVNFS